TRRMPRAPRWRSSIHGHKATYRLWQLLQSPCPDPVFLSCAVQVLGCLVWALIADTYYQPYPSYGWVMFVAIFFWLVTVILFGMYLFQLQMKLYMIPWPVVLVVFNVAATVLYATAFITSAASVEPYSWPHSPDYNRRASASFFACLVMIGYGVSACLSIRAWRGYGSDAATSQATFSNHA
uniref:Plasmolipin n=1 Tax=Varanus komodoensis TaxID=61221 RepID=A0A8D2KTJ6_VARKO